MGQFALQVSEFAKLAERNANLIVRKVAIDIFARVVMRTPVDSGRARGNWQINVGAAPSGAIARTDKQEKGSPPGPALASAALAAVATFEAGPDIYIVNNLPYINRLEYEGYSTQAPAGMVRVTVAEYQGLIAKAVEEVKNK